MDNRHHVVVKDAVEATRRGFLPYPELRKFNSTSFTPREAELFNAIFTYRIQVSDNGQEASLETMIEEFYRDRDIPEHQAGILTRAYLRGLAFAIDYNLKSEEPKAAEEHSDLTTTEFIEIMAKLNRAAPDMVSEDIDKMVRAAKVFKAEFM